MRKFSSMPVLELMKAIIDGKIDQRHLNLNERMAVIAVMDEQGFRVPEIARALKCCDKTVYRYIKRIGRSLAGITKEVNLDSVAGDAYKTNKILRSKAMRDGDLALAWHLTERLIASMQSMGILNKVADKLEIKHEQTEDFKKQNELFDYYEQRMFGSRSEN